MQLYLASRSPRRLALLEQIGLHPKRLNIEIDEIPSADEKAADYVQRLGLAKAQAGCLQIVAKANHWVLGSDTSVVVDGRILGKPINLSDATAMMMLLSGRKHQVMTSVALVHSHDLQVVSCLNINEVSFRPITMQEIESYWYSGEPQDKAGGYGIQGKGALFVEHLQGSFSGVMGLPLFETAKLLNRAGFNVL